MQRETNSHFVNDQPNSAPTSPKRPERDAFILKKISRNALRRYPLAYGNVNNHHAMVMMGLSPQKINTRLNYRLAKSFRENDALQAEFDILKAEHDRLRRAHDLLKQE